MKRTFVITGGTDGIGAAVARSLIARGDHVIVVGTDAAKGQRLSEEAAGDLDFIAADLSLVSENHRVVAEVRDSHPQLDGLILCARFFQTYRRVTAEGFEHNFALFYLSRALLGSGLEPALAKGDRPAIVNVAGPGHETAIDFDDLQSAKDYDGVRAMFMTGRLNDLLGVTFAQRHGGGPVRYVLFHPGTTSTSFAGEFDEPTARFIEQQKLRAKPATQVVAPVLRLLDSPPAEPLSAFTVDGWLGLPIDLYSPTDADRLATLTDELLSRPVSCGCR